MLIAMIMIIPLAIGLFVGLLDRRARPIVLSLLVVGGLLFLPLAWFFNVGRAQAENTFTASGNDEPVSILPDTHVESEEVIQSEPELESTTDNGTTNNEADNEKADDGTSAEESSSSITKPAKAPVVAEYPTNAPEWVESVPQLEDVTSIANVTRFQVVSGPYVDQSECKSELTKELTRSMNYYISSWVKDAPNRPRATFRANSSDLRLVRKVSEYASEREFSGLGPMQQLHVLYELKPTLDEHLRDRMEEAVVTERLAHTGVAFGGLIMVLGAAFSFLKYNIATHRVHQRRLKILATGTILAIIAAGVLAMRWVPWV